MVFTYVHIFQDEIVKQKINMFIDDAPNVDLLSHILVIVEILPYYQTGLISDSTFESM